MNTTTNDFKNIFYLDQRSNNSFTISTSSLILRYITSISLYVVILLINSVFEFTYMPIFILMIIQVTLLLLGGLFFGIGLQKNPIGKNKKG